MRSGWWWGTDEWEQYQRAYYAERERPQEWKSSPLAADEDFSDLGEPCSLTVHATQVIDLTLSIEELWRDVRPSYHSLIHRANERYQIGENPAIALYRGVHRAAFGSVRPDRTFAIQADWLQDGRAMVVLAIEGASGQSQVVAAALWIIYQNAAYWASGPSLHRSVQHAVLWDSLTLLKAQCVQRAELGVIDGITPKERAIGFFKTGWGGIPMPFTIARKLS